MWEKNYQNTHVHCFIKCTYFPCTFDTVHVRIFGNKNKITNSVHKWLTAYSDRQSMIEQDFQLIVI